LKTAIGLLPDVGGSFYLSHCKPNYATGMFIGLTAHRLNKYDMLYTGIGTDYIPSEVVKDFVSALKTYKWKSEIATWIQLEQIIARFQQPISIGKI
jgi:hypothetical protein